MRAEEEASAALGDSGRSDVKAEAKEDKAEAETEREEEREREVLEKLSLGPDERKGKEMKKSLDGRTKSE